MAKPESVTQKSAPQARVYQGTQEVHHDLFKLEVAEMTKNVSFDVKKPRFEKVEHVHFFHTVDSSGKKQHACNYVGNHFHEIEVIEKGDGVPEIKISKAMKHVMRDGEKVAIPVKEDQHTHTYTYRGSQLIKTRQVSAEFAKYQTAMDSRIPQSVEGIL